MISISTVLERLGIEARRVGREWRALCPNPEHADRNPSWRIRDDEGHERHGLHNCYPCGFGGDVVDLVRVKLDCSYAEARAWLGGAAAPAKPIPSLVDVTVRDRARGGPSFRFPSGVEFPAVGRWISAPLDYVRGRGVTPAQIERWGLGYAADGRLAGRIVIPYAGRDGVARSYSARAYRASDRKYMQPHPSEGADRSVVFGERFWPERRERVIVSEGEFNMLAWERVTSTPLAALSGSNPEPAKLAKLSTFAEIVIATDNDVAGEKAAGKLAQAWERYARVKRVTFPPGRDANDLEPDELIRLLEGVR